MIQVRACSVLIAGMVIALTGQSAYSRDYQFLNVGLRVSNTLGGRGGLTLGVEASFVWLSDFNTRPITAYGLTLAFDHGFEPTDGRSKLHVGAEGSLACFGLDLGPTLVLDAGRRSWGFTSIVYGGLLFYPFYSMTFIPHDRIDELGMFFKIPARNFDNWNYKFFGSARRMTQADSR
jgi:hypothetical protein